MENSQADCCAGCRVGEVLNAFRHQWKIHTVTPRIIHSPSFGAQRLSASMENSRSARRYAKIKEVLNAFRHQWKIHLDFLLVARGIVLCSTPFGINGKFTVDVTGCAAYCVGAQRLSASMENSPFLVINIFTAVLCSTPFGINGKFTRELLFC